MKITRFIALIERQSFESKRVTTDNTQSFLCAVLQVSELYAWHTVRRVAEGHTRFDWRVRGVGVVVVRRLHERDRWRVLVFRRRV